MKAPIYVFEVVAKTVSEMNQRGSWRPRHARMKAHKQAAFLLGRAAFVKGGPWPADTAAIAVQITRFAPGTLDTDNLASSQKGIRDGVAAAMGLDDGDPRIAWTYAQEKTKRGTYFVRVEIKPLRKAR